jgi:hypothetical protein
MPMRNPGWAPAVRELKGVGISRLGQSLNPSAYPSRRGAPYIWESIPQTETYKKRQATDKPAGPAAPPKVSRIQRFPGLIGGFWQ